MRRPASSYTLSASVNKPKMTSQITIVEPAKTTSDNEFVVEKLCDTLSKSFATAEDLFKRLNDLRHNNERSPSRQRGSLYHRRDSSSDGLNLDPRRDSFHRWSSRSRSRGRMDEDAEEFYKSRMRMAHTYDKHYNKYGDEMARGDLAAQNELQSQIIFQQQGIIAAYNIVSSPSPRRGDILYHLDQLRINTRTARSMAIDALEALTRRIRAQTRRSPSPAVGGLPYPEGDMDRIVIRSKSPGREGTLKTIQYDALSPPAYHLSPPHKPRSVGSDSTSSSLYCPYARDLQNDPHQPLSDDYKAEGNGQCPYCRFYIATSAGRSWEFSKIDGQDRKRGRGRQFMMSNRFVIKSHRDGGGYACLLCSKHRKADTGCKDVNALVEHIRREHSIGEIVDEVDIEEVD
ncbi:hypothetical protein EJ04DRAFT_520335 [Polyplosphaeria fusca]|uniref:Uncharacterized protein n=1 Tax=Polyplosphaeria fusca TaxID=682080 RepID=A0A9P4R7Q8_9PLEO|nr:hypothetical protein EJ04DRAFT_520335 [Polyplosphaeria fusca]